MYGPTAPRALLPWLLSQHFSHVQVSVCKVRKVGGSLSNLTSSKMLAVSTSNSVSDLQFGKARVYHTLHKPLLSASGGASVFRESGGLAGSRLKEDLSSDTVSENQEEWVSLPFFYHFSLSRCEQS